MLNTNVSNVIRASETAVTLTNESKLNKTDREQLSSFEAGIVSRSWKNKVADTIAVPRIARLIGLVGLASRSPITVPKTLLAQSTLQLAAAIAAHVASEICNFVGCFDMKTLCLPLRTLMIDRRRRLAKVLRCFHSKLACDCSHHRLVVYAVVGCEG